MKSNFRSCGNKGFQMTFENGYTISVQFGTGSYCAARDYSVNYGAEMKTTLWDSKTAEIAVWGEDPELIRISPSDYVIGHLSTEEVGVWIENVRNGKFEVFPIPTFD